VVSAGGFFSSFVFCFCVFLWFVCGGGGGGGGVKIVTGVFEPSY